VSGYVRELCQRYPTEVRLVPRRATKLGDHRPPTPAVPWHRITLNDDLNPQAFCVTLLHECAHVATHVEHAGRRRRLRPHGREWQQQFAAILRPVIENGLLPEDVVVALNRAAARPRAATCSDRHLLLVLSRYDAGGEHLCRVEDLRPGMLFETESGRRFVLGTRLRSRYRCLEATTGAEYRVHGLARVARVDLD
jgi:SprT protein